MKNMLHFALAVMIFFSKSLFSNAQCNIMTNAVAGTVTLQCVNGTDNRSGLVFDPKTNYYYSVDAGSSSYPIETFDLDGNLISDVAQGNDYRGLFWNDSLVQIEGNSFNSGPLVTQELDVDGIPTGNVTTIYNSLMQPDDQSCAAYDPVNRWILFYSDFTIYKRERYTNNVAGNVPVTGLPASTVNITSLIYTGCAGMEIGLYDYMNSIIYFVDEATGAYIAQSQLPPTNASNSSFRFAFANNLVWIFDPVSYIWESFNVFEPTAIVKEQKIITGIFPNPFSSSAEFRFSNQLKEGRLHIYDLTGKEVMAYKDIGGTAFILSAGNYIKGMYLYVLSEDGIEIGRGSMVAQ
jgi:hypothetical protein